MRRPVDQPYVITTEFGEPDSNALYGIHSGVDYYLPNQPTGSPVHAPTTGKIVYAQMHPLRGNMVVLFDGRFYHRLMHNSRFNVSVGQTVGEGDVVAFTGSTGLATGPHCHWDINTNGVDTTSFDQFVPPADWLAGKYDIPTPPPESDVLQPYQRRVKSEGVNYRKEPNTQAEIIQEFPPNDILDFGGYVHGENYGGIDIWFKGRYTGGYCWAGSFTDSSISGLPDVTPTPEPTPIPIPTPDPVPTPTPQPAPDPGTVVFPPDSTLVTEVFASPNFIEQTADPQYIVIHQWDAPDKHPTYQGVLNVFMEKASISPHYMIDDDHTTQLVPEVKRAQHAGPQGNDHYGIEFDPNGGEKMYARGRALIADMRQRTGKPLPLRGHNVFMPTDCPKYIDMARLEPETGTTLAQRVSDLEIFKANMIQFFKNQ